MYGVLAALVVVAHLAFILFVMFGGLLALRRPRAAWLHLPAFLWGGWIELSGGVCPLTPLENSLRRAAGAESYAVTFIEYYLLPVIYPGGLTRNVQLALAAGLVIANAIIYAWVLRRWRGRDPAGMS
jgi:hypothetical protein